MTLRDTRVTATLHGVERSTVYSKLSGNQQLCTVNKSYVVTRCSQPILYNMSRQPYKRRHETLTHTNVPLPTKHSKLTVQYEPLSKYLAVSTAIEHAVRIQVEIYL